MKTPHWVAAASAAILLSTACQASDLTRAEAKRMIEKAGVDAAYTEVSLSPEQMERLKSIYNAINILSTVFVMVSAPPQGPFALAKESNEAASYVDGGQRCVPDSNDMRLNSGQFVPCQTPLSLAITWQHPGILMKLKNPIKPIILEVTGFSDGSSGPNEQIVGYTWQYDLSALPQDVQDAIGPRVRSGRALFRLSAEGWKFVHLM
ncbi:MAG: hypothetical protein ACLQVG_23240 [Terriglobia bacterium]